MVAFTHLAFTHLAFALLAFPRLSFPSYNPRMKVTEFFGNAHGRRVFR